MENTKASVILCLALFLVFSSASAFDIVKLLEKQSALSSFTNYLKETKLGDEINKRSTITVLAVDNGGISSISGKSQDVIKKILSAHVVLDYFDEKKLTNLATSSKVSTLTTMFQSTGQAKDQQGFINVGMINEGELAFGSAVKGSNLNAKLVKSVVSQPFNLSVLQITNVIEIPDISAASSPASSPKSSASPAPSPSKKSSSDAPSPSSPSQSPKSSKSKAPSPSDEVSSPPVSGDASPASSPSADGPTGSSSSTPAPAPSAASRREIAVGAGVVIMGLATLLVA